MKVLSAGYEFAHRDDYEGRKVIPGIKIDADSRNIEVLEVAADSARYAPRRTETQLAALRTSGVPIDDYDGMMGYSLTKLRGMRHVYLYYFGGYRNMPQETAIRKIAIAKPYPNSNCLQCHSGKLDSFRDVREHTALREELETNHVACASAGCHGYSHPFSKGVTSEHATR